MTPPTAPLPTWALPQAASAWAVPVACSWESSQVGRPRRNSTPLRLTSSEIRRSDGGRPRPGVRTRPLTLTPTGAVPTRGSARGAIEPPKETIRSPFCTTSPPALRGSAEPASRTPAPTASRRSGRRERTSAAAQLNREELIRQ